MAQEQRPDFDNRDSLLAWVVTELEGTGVNRDNRRWRAPFSLSALFSHFDEATTVHLLFSQASGMAHDVIVAAIEIHNHNVLGLTDGLSRLILPQANLK